MKQIYYTLIFIFFIASTVKAQKETYNWYFGNKAGITFKTNPPTAITDGEMNTDEGCATISDKNGNLLFYTDGNTIWNKMHQQMSDGFDLSGDLSSTQSAVAVPDAAHPNLYYIFTMPAENPQLSHRPDTSFAYSVIDMSKNGGLGEVISKNNILSSSMTEKLTAVKTADGRGVWIITHQWGTNAFYCWLVDINGVDTTPVISKAGSVHTGSTEINKMGYLKASQDGSRLALAMYDDSCFEVFDFNNQTGIVSNPIKIKNGKCFNYAYGVEFSPDGTKLYGSSMLYSPDSSYVYQFDLSKKDSEEILKSTKVIALIPERERFFALQAGPDGKIYIANNNKGYLSVINNPNETGGNCDFVEKGIDLNGHLCQLGLPDFVQSFFYKVNIYSNSPICEGDTLELYASSLPKAIYKWSGPNGFTSSEQNPQIPSMSKSMEGEYNLEVIDSSGAVIQNSLNVSMSYIYLGFQPDRLELPTACILNSTSCNFTLKNQSNDEVTISSIKIKSNTNEIKLGDNSVVPFTLGGQETKDINITFTPSQSKIYYDTILLEVSNPCSKQYLIPVTGIGIAAKTFVSIPNLSAYPNDTISIPINARLSCIRSNVPSLSYKAEIAFDAFSFYPSDAANESITGSVVEDGMRIIKVEGKNVLIDSIDKSIGLIKGTVLLGLNNFTPIEIRSFVWSDTLFDAFTQNGSLTTLKVCKDNLRKVTAFKPLTVSVIPNPSDSHAEISISSDITGLFILKIYNINGAEAKTVTIEKNRAEDYLYSLDTSTLPAGLYRLVVTNPAESAGETIVITR